MEKDMVLKEDVRVLATHEKFSMIDSVNINTQAILKYLKNRLQNLFIEIGGDYEGTIFELMDDGFLEGWCWQTTESAVVFFKDNDYIERGYLTINTTGEYLHSWICFNFENKEYVFDPSLQILTERSIYHYVFEVSLKSTISARKVRQDLISEIEEYKMKHFSQESERFLKKFFSQSLLSPQKSSYILGDDNIYSSMYRNSTGYNIIIKNGEIQKLIAHYYHNG